MLSSIVRKLRIWGVRGAINYILGRRREYALRRFFLKNAADYPYAESERGITVIGFLSSRGSLCKTLRDFCFSLKDAGIPFQTFDTGMHEIPDEDVAAILTPISEFRIKRYSHVVEMINSPLPEGIVEHVGRIAFWEFESGLLEAFPTFLERTGSIIAMSDFNAKYYARLFAGKREVHKILYPLRIETDGVLPKQECRRRFGLEADDFVVFYNFSYSSGWGRKNPLGALKAFLLAFREIPRAKLVFKTFAREAFEDRADALKRFAQEEGVDDRVIFVDDYLTQKDVFNLTNACDVYLSLHRAEGFGIGIAEAMSLGKSVVVTDYSSTTEFCNVNNSIPVPFRMVDMDHADNVMYLAADKWAEPDVESAAAALKRLYEDSESRVRLGDAAQKSIRSQFSIENFGDSVRRFLSERAAVC